MPGEPPWQWFYQATRLPGHNKTFDRTIPGKGTMKLNYKSLYCWLKRFLAVFEGLWDIEELWHCIGELQFLNVANSSKFQFIDVPWHGIGEEVDLEDEVNDDDDEGEPALVMTVLLWAKVHSARQIPVITQIGQIWPVFSQPTILHSLPLYISSLLILIQ